ncbi:sensor histidine kinase [Nocardioides kribbensis]|uniref:Sensor-like histidine kinase SenX3 n=1 Tax=Nocardioides kribbensis TaxID=305517 RepID=A0ABV1NWI2_9ACTN
MRTPGRRDGAATAAAGVPVDARLDDALAVVGSPVADGTGDVGVPTSGVAADVDPGRDAERAALRAAEVRRYRLPELTRLPELRAIVELAAQVCEAPRAMLTFFTDSEMHQLATHGFRVGPVPNHASVCHRVLHDPAPLIEADLAAQGEWSGYPAVEMDPPARLYVSQQLRTPAGVPFGSLCVLDSAPRELDAAQRAAVANLAERAVDVLELALRSRQLDEALAEVSASRDELERSNAQLAAYAGQVTHDLRNPLSAIAASLELMEDVVAEGGPDGPAQLSALVVRARRSAHRMEALISDVLSFAGIGGELELTEVSLERLVAEAREDLATELEVASVEVGPLPHVRADAVQLRVVLQNLLGNAAKYVAPGATARVEVRTEPATDPGSVRLVVVDHGLGVAEADRDRVFKPLERVHTAVAGTGMGLATCRRVVEAHGGAIGLRGTPGGGATVWLELPDAVLPATGD